MSTSPGIDRVPELSQDLLDPGDRLVDRLLGADALGGARLKERWASV